MNHRILHDFPWKTIDASKGLKADYEKFYYKNDIKITKFHKSDLFDGFRLIIHSPYEIPSQRSMVYHTISNSSVVFWVEPELLKIDGSLSDDLVEK